ncbi:MAG: glycosyltransferase family 4 protein [Mediterranea sp.]|jgi:glycosyltransferase involved in cell wall biosynthesis|nr:glycosyltransferase family 4 protein [Mediterranea sp.]
MRVLLINTSERIGGAAIAAGRLAEALKNNGIKAKLLVRDKQTENISVVRLERSWLSVWNFVWERAVIWMANRFRRNNLFAVDIANTGTNITSLPEFKQADIIHLHWINQGMLSLKDLRKIFQSGKPVVWTMHDMWPCTGICHHARECGKYQTECHECPFLYRGGTKDLSYRVFRKKKKLYRIAPITFVACSQWLKGLAQKSALLVGHNVINIPNPINTNLFKPGNRNVAREKLNLPKDMPLILFGSVKIKDERKGVAYFAEACNLLAAKHPELKEKLGVVVFGHHSDYLENRLPFRVYALNYVKSEHDMTGIYNAVNLYATPSLEDNLPNTIMEAMACGVPCVGFNVGGIPEMIDHLHNGYVARYKSAEDFANGIYWTLTESEHALLSEQAIRKVAVAYSERTVAKRYIDMYNKVTSKHA